MSGVREQNILLGKTKDIAFQFYSFIVGSKRTQQQYRSRMTLVSAYILCLDLLLYIQLFILEQQNIIQSRGKFKSKELYNKKKNTTRIQRE